MMKTGGYFYMQGIVTGIIIALFFGGMSYAATTGSGKIGSLFELLTSGSENGSTITNSYRLSGSSIKDKSISHYEIIDGTIRGDLIANNTITNSKIQDNSISSAKIITGTIQSDDISTGGVSLTNLGTNSVNSSKILDNSITTSDVLNNTLTASDLDENSVGNSELIDNPTVNTIYAPNWFRSTGSTGWYNGTHGGGWYMSDASWIRSYGSKNVYINTMLRADAGFQVDAIQVIGADAWIEGDRIRQNSIDSSEIQNNTLTADDLAANSVGASELQNYSVSRYKLANNSIYSNHIAAGQVTNSDIGNSAVNSIKIQNNTLTAADLAPNSVGNSELIASPTFTTVRASSYLYVSDKNLKDDIQKLNNSYDKISKIDGVSFNWQDGSGSDIGVIAQNIEEVYPELVNTDDETGYKSVKYGNLIGPIIEALKELGGKIEGIIGKYADQEQEIRELEGRIAALEEIITAIK